MRTILNPIVDSVFEVAKVNVHVTMPIFLVSLIHTTLMLCLWKAF